MLRSFIAASCLLVAIGFGRVRQGGGFHRPDSPTVATKRTLVRQIRDALPASDL